MLEETSGKDGGLQSGITNLRILVQAEEQVPGTQGTIAFQAHNTSLPRENMCKWGKIETRRSGINRTWKQHTGFKEESRSDNTVG